jgi:hypothetical protein
MLGTLAGLSASPIVGRSARAPAARLHPGAAGRGARSRRGTSRPATYGTPDDVAEFLASYAVAGCREFNLIPQAPGHDYAIAGTAAVKRAWNEHDRHTASRRLPAARN